MKIFFLYFINTEIHNQTTKSKCVSVHAFQKRGQDGIRHERELMGERQEKAGGTSHLDADRSIFYYQ